MIAIFVVGQVGWFLVFERWWFFHKQKSPLQEILTQANSNPVELEKKLRADSRLRGVFAEMSQAILQSKTNGKDAMVREAREVLRGSGNQLNRHLGTIAVLATSAPLLGLAGTVNGIMGTFAVITAYGMGNPAMLSGGIAEALMVTEAGLVVAFPLLLLHNHLQNRADHIEAQCKAGATVLIRVFSSPEVRA